MSRTIIDQFSRKVFYGRLGLHVLVVDWSAEGIDTMIALELA